MGNMNMTKLLAGVFAAAFVFGLSLAPALTYAEEDAMEEAEQGTMDAGDEAMSEESDAMEEPQEDAVEEAEDSDKAE